MSRSGYATPSWTIGYNDPDWVFLESIQFNIDGVIRTLTFDQYQDVQDYIGGGVAEWVQPSFSANRELLDEMADAESVVLVFTGRQRRENREMTSSDLTALRDMLELYDLRAFIGG